MYQTLDKPLIVAKWDGNLICASWADDEGKNIQEAPHGFGPDVKQAIEDLINNTEPKRFGELSVRLPYEKR